VQEKVKIFVRRAQREFDLPIKKIRSDNGTEFKNTLVEEFLDDKGIKHEFSTPCTPQQNGVVERKNHTLLDMAWTMLDEYETSDLFLFFFWTFIQGYVKLYNRITPLTTSLGAFERR